MSHRTACALSVCLVATTLASAQHTTLIDHVLFGEGESLVPSRPCGKSIAVNRAGHLFVLGRWLSATNQSELRLYRSADRGQTFHLETRARTNDAIRGSMVLDPDGDTLHLVWGDNPANHTDSVWYGRYDTHFAQWLDPDVEVFPGGPGMQDWYWPDIDLTPAGRPVVACSGGRDLGWRASMRYFDGSVWRAPLIVNRGESGVTVNVVADERGRFHFTYRTQPTSLSSSHIAYRRFDPATSQYSPEVLIEERTSNISCLAIDRAGTRHVLLARDGALVLATAKAGSDEFVLREITRDRGYDSANTNYYHYGLGMEGDTPWCYYAHEERGRKEIFARALIGGSLTTEFIVGHAPTGTVETVAAFRSRPSELQHSMVWTVRNEASGELEYHARSAVTGVVGFGAACPDSDGRRPRVQATGLPTPGNESFGIELSGATPSAAAILLIGDSDAQLAGVPLPLYLGFLGMPGCLLYQNARIPFPSTTDAAGALRMPLPIPVSSSLRGARLIGQWLVGDPIANVAGIVTSPALAMFID